MDKYKQKKMARIIEKELSRVGRSQHSKPTTRDILIRIVSIYSGLMFLFGTITYYGRLFRTNPLKVSASSAQVQQYSRSRTKADQYDSKEKSEAANFKKLGDESLKQNNETDAIMYYKQAIKNNIYDSDVLGELINLLFKGKQYNDSLEYVEKFINIEPSNISAYRVKGSSLYMLERYEEAIKVFSKVVEMDPKDNNSYKLMGDMSLRLCKYDEAINNYKMALSIKDEDVPVYQNMGVAAARSGRIDEALEYYEKALQLDPQNEQILKNKQEILSVQKQ